METETRSCRSRLRKALKVLGLMALAGLAVLVGVLATPVEPTIPGIEPRPGTRWWHMADGHRLAYHLLPAASATAAEPAATGPGAAAAVEAGRPAVIYLHGGPGGYVHSSTLAALEPLAAAGYPVYAYDQVGSGLSDRLPQPKDYTFQGHLEDLLEIVDDHLDGGPVVLIGQSYGGILAAHFVARHPRRVAAAILTSPGSLQPLVFDDEGRALHIRRYPVPAHLDFVDPVESEGWGVSEWPLRAIASVAWATVANRKLMPDQEADGVLNTIASRITRSMACDPDRVPPEEGGGGFYSHGWSNWFGGVTDPRPALAESPVPLLVLQGQCDYLPYAAAYEYADLLPRGEYRFVPGAGHTLYWDRPDIFATHLVPFLERVAGRRHP